MSYVISDECLRVEIKATFAKVKRAPSVVIFLLKWRYVNAQLRYSYDSFPLHGPASIARQISKAMDNSHLSTSVFYVGLSEAFVNGESRYSDNN